VLEKKTAVVHGCAGIDDFPEPDRTMRDGFNIGYLGLIDFSKLHPDYLAFCRAVDIPCAQFTLAGDGAAAARRLDHGTTAS